MKLNLLPCGLLALFFSTAVFAAAPPPENSSALKNAVILIIRHAEKPDAGHGLSAAGVARADAYVNYFKNYQVNGQPLKLTSLFATADSKQSHRPRLTLEPTSKALGLTIDSRFKDENYQGLVNELQSKPHGEGILIAWHHQKIPALLQALGADPKQVIPRTKWPESVYGWLTQLRYDENGHLIEAKRIEEKLMPDDLSNPGSAISNSPAQSSP